MTLITLTDIERRFGDHVVLDGASLRIEERERVGVIGDNGAGKTTLIRILAGVDHQDHGTRQPRRNLTIAYGEQMPDLPPGTGVRDAVLQGNCTFAAMQAEVERLEARLAESPEDEKLLAEYGHRQAAFEAGGGYDREHVCEKVLDGLGFGEDSWDKRVDVLSGGERSRVQLAVLMTTPADLLILDEPTNHLDLQGIEFVEGLIQKHPGSVLTISHDRRFLDAIATRIVEVTAGQAASYKGNYAAYKKQRDVQLLSEKRAFKKQRDVYEKEMAYIRKNMAGRMSQQAKGRLKRLQRMELLDRPRKERQAVRLSFSGRRGMKGQTMLEVKGLSVALPDGRVLVEDADLKLLHGETMGLLGRNGAGKTTFLKAILGQYPVRAGEVDLAHGVKVGSFSQDTRDLPTDGSVLDALRLVDPRAEDRSLRDHLALFLFSGDEVELPVSSLSGGERQRLNLARLTRTDFDLLCLDEPTNHLDIATAESLTEALGEYPGAVLVISHDRAFVEELTDRVAYLADRTLRVFDGGLDQCLKALADEKSRARGAEKAAKERAAQAEEKAAQAKAAEDAPKKVKNPLLFERLESRIMELEEELETVRSSMTTPEVYADHRKMAAAQDKEQTLQTELQEAYETWENWEGA